MAKTTNQSQSLWLVNGCFFSKWPLCENDDLPMDGTGMNGVMLVKHSKAMSWASHVLMVYITIYHTFMIHLGIKSHLEILNITDGCWGNLGRWRPKTISQGWSHFDVELFHCKMLGQWSQWRHFCHLDFEKDVWRFREGNPTVMGNPIHPVYCNCLIHGTEISWFDIDTL